jgi:hypothetical protein
MKQGQYTMFHLLGRGLMALAVVLSILGCGRFAREPSSVTLQSWASRHLTSCDFQHADEILRRGGYAPVGVAPKGQCYFGFYSLTESERNRESHYYFKTLKSGLISEDELFIKIWDEHGKCCFRTSVRTIGL